VPLERAEASASCLAAPAGPGAGPLHTGSTGRCPGLEVSDEMSQSPLLWQGGKLSAREPKRLAVDFHGKDSVSILNPQIRPQCPPDDLRLRSALLLRPLSKRQGLVLMQVAHLAEKVRTGKALGVRRLLPALHYLRGYLILLSTLVLG
jgi:hypothetical protein